MPACARFRAGLGFAVQSAAFGIALAGPWLWLIAGRALIPAFEHPTLQLREDGYNTLNQDRLWAGQNRLLIALALVAALWSLRRRALPAIEQVGWVGALVVLANPWLASYLLPAVGASVLCYGLSYRRPLVACVGAPLLLLNPALLHLPYLRLIPNDIVTISLFIPISVLLGGAAAALPGVERGADGGWWLLPLAGRWISTPPAIFIYAAPGDVRAIQERNRIVAGFRPGQQRAIDDLIE